MTDPTLTEHGMEHDGANGTASRSDAQRVLQALEVLGIDRAELLASLGTKQLARQLPTFGELIDGVERAITSQNSRRTWRTHYRRVLDGTATICSCRCDACLDVEAGCACGCGTCTSSRRSIPALRDERLDAHLTRSEWEEWANLAKLLSIKRARRQNISRAARGRTPVAEHGNGGKENFLTAWRHAFKVALGDGLIDRNPLGDIAKPMRGEASRRGLSDDELSELFDTVATGGDDPELDFHLSWFHLETGARRAGGIRLRLGDIDVEGQTIRVFEKFDKYRLQPVSQELACSLVAFCVSRVDSADALTPVFHYRRLRNGAPAPLTSRRYDTLHERIQTVLPWADRIGLTSHGLRYTGAVLVERIAGTQVARRFLGHASRHVTDTYSKADLAELAAAIAKLTGSPHPLAGGASGGASA